MPTPTQLREFETSPGMERAEFDFIMQMEAERNEDRCTVIRLDGSGTHTYAYYIDLNDGIEEGQYDYFTDSLEQARDWLANDVNPWHPNAFICDRHNNRV